ncbi:MAG: ABC transporter permease [Desulfatibacillaceae bacterium]
MRIRHALFLAAVFTVFAGPLVILVMYSASSHWIFPQVIPETWDARAFSYVAGQARQITVSMGSSIVYSLLTVACSLVLCILPAQVFARHRFRGRSLLEGLLLAPALVPAMTFSMGMHTSFIRFGLADTLPGVVLVLTIFAYPYMLRALVTGYMAFGPEYDVCAKNLGAGFFLRIFKVEIPLLMPALIAGGSVVFLVAFSEYFLVFLIGGGSVPSYAGYLFPLLNSSDRAVGSLLTLIFLAVPLVLFVLVETLVARRYRRMGLF